MLAASAVSVAASLEDPVLQVDRLSSADQEDQPSLGGLSSADQDLPDQPSLAGRFSVDAHSLALAGSPLPEEDLVSVWVGGPARLAGAGCLLHGAGDESGSAAVAWGGVGAGDCVVAPAR